MSALYGFLAAPFVDVDFMRRALAGLLALSLGATPMGVFLLLRRMSLMGDAMSHAILPGAALGYLASGLSLGVMTAGGIAAGLLVVFAAGLVARTSNLQEDASLAAFYLLSLAAGITIVSLSGHDVDLMHVLFGSVMTLGADALLLIAAISSLSLVGLALLFRPLALECFDSAFLRGVGRGASPVAYYGFMILVVFDLVAGFHSLGTLMAVGIMILPAASARLWTRNLAPMLALAAALAFVCGVAGLLLSYHAGHGAPGAEHDANEIDPAGAAIVLVCGLVYFASLLAAPGGLLAQRWLTRRKHLSS